MTRTLRQPATGIVMIGIVLILCMADLSQARVSGLCGDCHTMHYSQDGIKDISWGQDGPYDSLLIKGCIGCHTGNNTAPDTSTEAPYVLAASLPTYDYTVGATHDTLAGGDFWWVDQGDDRAGHNVNGIVARDAAFSAGADIIPGTSTAYSTYNSGNGLNCAGTNGCHGERDEADNELAMAGTHHIRNNRTATSYRFLEIDASTVVAGKEDSDWEFTLQTTDHNQYKGVDRTDDTDSNGSQLDTISSFCASCHGFYHHDTAAGTGTLAATDTWSTDPWIRHPVDFDMPTSGEYTAYAAYSPLAPVASTNVAAVISAPTAGTDQRIVMCLSCHRAHGSPNEALMRWDWRGWPGSGEHGCQVCHSTKD